MGATHEGCTTAVLPDGLFGPVLPRIGTRPVCAPDSTGCARIFAHARFHLKRCAATRSRCRSSGSYTRCRHGRIWKCQGRIGKKREVMAPFCIASQHETLHSRDPYMGRASPLRFLARCRGEDYLCFRAAYNAQRSGPGRSAGANSTKYGQAAQLRQELLLAAPASDALRGGLWRLRLP